jgi:hypothetical protein
MDLFLTALYLLLPFSLALPPYGWYLSAVARAKRRPDFDEAKTFPRPIIILILSLFPSIILISVPISIETLFGIELYRHEYIGNALLRAAPVSAAIVVLTISFLRMPRFYKLRILLIYIGLNGIAFINPFTGLAGACYYFKDCL